MKKPSSVSISKLARYASDPADIFKKVDQQAVRYGNRAHGRIGKAFIWDHVESELPGPSRVDALYLAHGYVLGFPVA